MRATEKIVSGVTFVESLTDIRKVVDTILEVDEGLQGERTLSMEKSFNMKKGGAYNLPESIFRGGDDLFIGLGWECEDDVDLDASILAIYKPNESKVRDAEPIYFGRQSGCGGAVKHQGDNRTGDGKGDDEVILIDLDAIPDNIESLVVVVNVYSSEYSFKNVKDAYVRLVACGNNHEFARFNLDDTVKSSGIIFLKIARSCQPKTWCVEPVGEEVDGPRAVTMMAEACGVTGELRSRFKGSCCVIS
jgi:stress response protein SCP2